MLMNYSLLKELPSPSMLADRVRSRMAFESTDNETLLKLCLNEVFGCYKCYALSLQKCADLVRKVYCCIRCDLEILQDLLDDPKVSEIMVNGYKNVFIEREGQVERADICLDSKDQLISIIQRLAAGVGREINDLNPIVDARLPDGSRVNAVNDNIALGGPILTIRKFGKTGLQMDDLIERNDISKEAAEFLNEAVKIGCNIFISGGTSSGKTTFLNILSDCIPKNERIIVIEDSAELQIRNHENVVRMEARSSNALGKGAVSIRELIKTSLRMRPDRIIVGEVRGDEVIDMLAAMSTGHDGSLSTGHANSPEGMIGRLETMHISGSSFPLTAVRSQIADAIDLIVQLKRFQDGHRRVTEITEVCKDINGEIRLNTLFERDDEGILKRTGRKEEGRKLKGIHGL